MIITCQHYHKRKHPNCSKRTHHQNSLPPADAHTPTNSTRAGDFSTHGHWQKGLTLGNLDVKPAGSLIFDFAVINNGENYPNAAKGLEFQNGGSDIIADIETYAKGNGLNITPSQMLTSPKLRVPISRLGKH